MLFVLQENFDQHGGSQVMENAPNDVTDINGVSAGYTPGQGARPRQPQSSAPAATERKMLNDVADRLVESPRDLHQFGQHLGHTERKIHQIKTSKPNIQFAARALVELWWDESDQNDKEKKLVSERSKNTLSLCCVFLVEFHSQCLVLFECLQSSLSVNGLLFPQRNICFVK